MEGCVCHTYLPDRSVSVIISGPSVMTVDDTATFKLQMIGGPDIAGGCDISASLGDLQVSYLDQDLQRMEQYPGSGFELTHIEPKLFTTDTLEFIFKYKAPSVAGIFDTIFANGNSVNHDTTPSDDKWNYAGNFLIEIVDNPLPVELTSFTSSVIGNNVLLNWTTASEQNNSGFEIQRSMPDGKWNVLGFIQGIGNSEIQHDYYYSDKNLIPGSYGYRLKQIDFNGNFKFYELAGEVNIGLPSDCRLFQNFPNPFNPSTVISYNLSYTANVNLKIYDAAGKEIRELVNKFQNAGNYSMEFIADNLPSGIYFYKLTAGNFSDVKRMILVK
ncbi:MAG TPA: T9SS type A sorting domain-containing protein [Ignavibacteria bacterium]|nr:T9SS type A sorting domain-containing protein [Ignavibacteria bacterium]